MGYPLDDEFVPQRPDAVASRLSLGAALCNSLKSCGIKYKVGTVGSNQSVNTALEDGLVGGQVGRLTFITISMGMSNTSLFTVQQ